MISWERNCVDNLRQYCITVESRLDVLLRTIISVTALPELTSAVMHKFA